jgi:hypothetical protein
MNGTQVYFLLCVDSLYLEYQWELKMWQKTALVFLSAQKNDGEEVCNVISTLVTFGLKELPLFLGRNTKRTRYSFVFFWHTKSIYIWFLILYSMIRLSNFWCIYWIYIKHFLKIFMYSKFRWLYLIYDKWSSIFSSISIFSMCIFMYVRICSKKLRCPS